MKLNPPSDEELAAIVAAVELVWPRPVVAASPEERGANMWRFSGRWWSRPHAVQRDRPWIERR